jgi:light-regulated signal transduction histidine kinase (bacteriophytochrome)
MEVISLNDVVSDALINIGSLAEEHQAEIRIGDLPQVLGDRWQLALVFQNLITNSIRYRKPDEHPRIDVMASKDQIHWTISVADNGQGFEMEFAEEIFSPFKRLHGQDVAGTGMGLAICQKIVHRHGGRIWATSTLGVGTMVSFTLPVLKDRVSG